MPRSEAEYMSSCAITYKIDVSMIPLGCMAIATAESRTALTRAIPL